MTLTVHACLGAALDGMDDAEVDAWLQVFLRGERGNVALADGLRLRRRFYGLAWPRLRWPPFPDSFCWAAV
jgi:hypothetical protein